MSLSLRNTWHYKGDKVWKWEAFLDDAGSGELANVKSVDYVLHSTFVDPVRRIEDPSGGFRLRTEGWGEFSLRAFALMRDGSKKQLNHYVELKSDPPTGVSEPSGEA